MSERDDLLVSIANCIGNYRLGDIERPSPGHVDRWASQFSLQVQLPFLREFNHVIRKSFIERDRVKQFLTNLVHNPKLVGNDAVGFWRNSNFLSIQQNGTSQREMLLLFDECLQQTLQLSVQHCGNGVGQYIYLDDIVFSGTRLGTDLQTWIRTAAPPQAKVSVIVIGLHSAAEYYLKHKWLNRVIAESGKDISIEYWRAFTPENRRTYSYSSDVLWPTRIPDGELAQAYVALEGNQPAYRTPGGRCDIFSSEEGRQLVEQEFLLAGLRIRSQINNPNPILRPLGFGRFGFGFGSTFVTYRNCPNNCPLALWWGNGNAADRALSWYPLLPRRTYDAPENVFGRLNGVIL